MQFSLLAVVVSGVLGFSNTTNNVVHVSSSSERQVLFQNFISSDAPVYAASKVKVTCKTGTKLGKTPVKTGGKPGCYNIKLAASGKKLLTTDSSNSCLACHVAGGINPYTLMNTNLNNQGYSRSVPDIVASFNAHVDQMAGATMTAAQAKQISNFLQSIK